MLLSILVPPQAKRVTHAWGVASAIVNLARRSKTVPFVPRPDLVPLPRAAASGGLLSTADLAGGALAPGAAEGGSGSAEGDETLTAWRAEVTEEGDADDSSLSSWGEDGSDGEDAPRGGDGPAGGASGPKAAGGAGAAGVDERGSAGGGVSGGGGGEDRAASWRPAARGPSRLERQRVFVVSDPRGLTHAHDHVRRCRAEAPSRPATCRLVSDEDAASMALEACLGAGSELFRAGRWADGDAALAHAALYAADVAAAAAAERQPGPRDDGAAWRSAAASLAGSHRLETAVSLTLDGGHGGTVPVATPCLPAADATAALRAVAVSASSLRRLRAASALLTAAPADVIRAAARRAASLRGHDAAADALRLCLAEPGAMARVVAGSATALPAVARAFGSGLRAACLRYERLLLARLTAHRAAVASAGMEAIAPGAAGSAAGSAVAARLGALSLLGARALVLALAPAWGALERLVAAACPDVAAAVGVRRAPAGGLPPSTRHEPAFRAAAVLDAALLAVSSAAAVREAPTASLWSPHGPGLACPEAADAADDAASAATRGVLAELRRRCEANEAGGRAAHGGGDAGRRAGGLGTTPRADDAGEAGRRRGGAEGRLGAGGLSEPARRSPDPEPALALAGPVPGPATEADPPALADVLARLWQASLRPFLEDADRWVRGGRLRCQPPALAALAPAAGIALLARLSREETGRLYLALREGPLAELLVVSEWCVGPAGAPGEPDGAEAGGAGATADDDVAELFAIAAGSGQGGATSPAAAATRPASGLLPAPPGGLGPPGAALVAASPPSALEDGVGQLSPSAGRVLAAAVRGRPRRHGDRRLSRPAGGGGSADHFAVSLGPSGETAPTAAALLDGAVPLAFRRTGAHRTALAAGQLVAALLSPSGGAGAAGEGDDGGGLGSHSLAAELVATSARMGLEGTLSLPDAAAGAMVSLLAAGSGPASFSAPAPVAVAAAPPPVPPAGSALRPPTRQEAALRASARIAGSDAARGSLLAAAAVAADTRRALAASRGTLWQEDDPEPTPWAPTHTHDLPALRDGSCHGPLGSAVLCGDGALSTPLALFRHAVARPLAGAYALAMARLTRVVTAELRLDLHLAAAAGVLLGETPAAVLPLLEALVPPSRRVAGGVADVSASWLARERRRNGLSDVSGLRDEARRRQRDAAAEPMVRSTALLTALLRSSTAAAMGRGSEAAAGWEEEEEEAAGGVPGPVRAEALSTMRRARRFGAEGPGGPGGRPVEAAEEEEEEGEDSDGTAEAGRGARRQGRWVRPEDGLRVAVDDPSCPDASLLADGGFRLVFAPPWPLDCLFPPPVARTYSAVAAVLCLASAASDRAAGAHIAASRRARVLAELAAAMDPELAVMAAAAVAGGPAAARLPSDATAILSALRTAAERRPGRAETEPTARGRGHAGSAGRRALPGGAGLLPDDDVGSVTSSSTAMSAGSALASAASAAGVLAWALPRALHTMAAGRRVAVHVTAGLRSHLARTVSSGHLAPVAEAARRGTPLPLLLPLHAAALCRAARGALLGGGTSAAQAVLRDLVARCHAVCDAQDRVFDRASQALALAALAFPRARDASQRIALGDRGLASPVKRAGRGRRRPGPGPTGAADDAAGPPELTARQRIETATECRAACRAAGRALGAALAESEGLESALTAAVRTLRAAVAEGTGNADVLASLLESLDGSGVLRGD